MSTSPTASAYSGKPAPAARRSPLGLAARRSAAEPAAGRAGQVQLPRARSRRPPVGNRSPHPTEEPAAVAWRRRRRFPYQSPFGRELRADYRTATGEIKPIVLSDGTQLVLNTASAVDVHYDDRQRLIRLHAGEISLITGRDPGRCGCKAHRGRCARTRFWCARSAARRA